MLSHAFITSALAALAWLPHASEAAPAGFNNFKRADDLKFSFGSEKVRGVNLGGWLVLEPWITPSIFEATADNVVDEYTFGQTLGQDAGYTILSDHWNSWIQESDIQAIAAAGMNFVRIPVGFWSVPGVDSGPYVTGAYDFLKAACDWAAGAGIKVLIDLHGAQGSQNGFDNSGQRGSIAWTQGDSIAATHQALNQIRDDLAAHSAVAAIELINEPLGSSLDMDTVRQFYMDGWGDLESSNVAITFHDAFQGATSWNDWGSGMWALVLDTHHYEVFSSGELDVSPQDHLDTACGFGASLTSNNKWTIAGEWSGAFTDCAKWLNGRGVGARYDGTYNYNGGSSYYIGSCDGKYSGSVADLSSADKDNIGRFVEAQMDAFEEVAGWIFWTWKTEGAPEWDMQALLAGGIFPNPVTNRNHPGQCS